MQCVKLLQKPMVKSFQKVKTRELRTRHGDIVQVSTYEADIELKTSRGSTKYHIPAGSTVFAVNGLKVKKGDKLAEFEPGSQGEGSRLTEKATKDITSDLSGEILFEGFVADERKDRQGNVSRTANKNGIVWVLGGDVYNLRAVQKCLLKMSKKLKKVKNLLKL